MSGLDHNRRDFLKSTGRFAATVPPAMTVLLSTSLSSPAIAQSSGRSYSGSSTGSSNRSTYASSSGTGSGKVKAKGKRRLRLAKGKRSSRRA